jgi:hypothetical protein
LELVIPSSNISILIATTIATMEVKVYHEYSDKPAIKSEDVGPKARIQNVVFLVPLGHLDMIILGGAIVEVGKHHRCF